MSGLWTIAWREYCSYFRLPAGWITIALYLFLSGVIFGRVTLIPGGVSSLRGFFWWSQGAILFVAPAVSMRLLSEEFRSGTFESLMTAPVSDLGIILGKYTGAALFLASMLAPTVLYAVILRTISTPPPDAGPILAGYLSLILLGLLCLAIGTLASALTDSQLLAFLSTFMVLLVLLMLPAMIAASPIPETSARIALALAIAPRIGDFAKGVIDTSHIVYFLTASAWFLALAFAAVQSRRWR